MLDLASKGVADLSKCHTVIMDEADKLLSPEFQVRERYCCCCWWWWWWWLLLLFLLLLESDGRWRPKTYTHNQPPPHPSLRITPQPILEQLLEHCMPGRQIGLFSATFPVAVKAFKVHPCACVPAWLAYGWHCIAWHGISLHPSIHPSAHFIHPSVRPFLFSRHINQHLSTTATIT